MARDTFTPRDLAKVASAWSGETISPRLIRGLARGDSGTPVLPAYDDDKRTTHLYSIAESRKLLEAVASRRRISKALPAPFGVKRAPKAPKAVKVTTTPE